MYKIGDNKNMNQELSNFSDTQQSIDLAVLDSLRAMLGNDELIFAKVIECYLEEAPQIIEDISNSIKNQDSQMLEQTAHKLKSSSASMGAKMIYSLCSQLEDLGENGSVEGSLETFSQLTQEYERVENILRSKISNG